MAQICPQTIFEAFTLNGLPLSGGRVWTYAAGTSNPLASFTDATGATANSNPVILDSRGQAPIWLGDGLAYKIRVEEPSGALLWETDDVVGVPSSVGEGGATQADEWLIYSGTPSYISATSFSVPGNETATFHVGRRTRSEVTGGTSYGTIQTSVFATGNTTITLANDSLPLDAGLSAVAYGILSADNPSASTECIAGLANAAFVPTGAILHFGGSSAPPGFLLCDGASYAVASQTALHNVIGDTFGGDGGTNFNVPDVRNRALVGFGALDGTGAAATIGVKQGAEETTLALGNLPNINGRDPAANQADANRDNPGSTFTAAQGVNTNIGGSSTPFNNRAPELPVGAIIKT